jgi:hypothetical protein
MKEDVITLFEKTTEQEILDLSKDLPTDVHLIEYEENNDFFLDAVRAYKKADVFDTYYDRLNQKAMDGDLTSFSIISIRNGYGIIKPILWETE